MPVMLLAAYKIMSQSHRLSCVIYVPVQSAGNLDKLYSALLDSAQPVQRKAYFRLDIYIILFVQVRLRT